MGSNPSPPTKKIKHCSSNIDKRHNESCSTQVTHITEDDAEDVRLAIESQKASKLMMIQEDTSVHANNNDSQHEDEKTINGSEQEIVKSNDVCEFSCSNDRRKCENNSIVNDSTKSVSNNNAVKRLFTLSDVQNMHRGNPNRILIIVENDLYDLTGFAQHHPGGSTVLRDYSGTDATSIFQSVHGDDAYVELKHWFLGHFSNDLRGDSWIINNKSNNNNDNNNGNQIKLTKQTSQSGSNIVPAIPTEERKLQNLSWMLERPCQSKLQKQITSQNKEDNIYTNQKIFESSNEVSANNKHDDNVNSATDSNNNNSSLLLVENGAVTMEAIETYIHEDKCNEHRKRYVIILFGDVYDVSNYAEMHPGGTRVFDKNNGKECGSIFIRIHGLRARKLVNEFYVGRLKGSRLQRPSSLPLPRKLT